MPRVTTLRGRVGTAVGTLIILAGAGILAAASTQATASTAPAQGVDVSAYTTVSSWSQLQQAGNSFTGVEATEGNYYTDPDYASDVASATGAGLYVIPYVFANPYGSQQSSPPNGTAAAQADYAVKELQTASPSSGSLMLPLALDMEPDPYTATESNSNQCYGLTAAQMVTWIRDFISEAESDLKALSPSPVPATAPIIYTSASWWDACTGGSTAFGGSDPLWDADWGVSAPAIPAGWDNYTFWQYSDTGTPAGTTGDVDLDYLGPVQLTSAEGTAIGGVRLSTLTSLRGQADTFASSSLPPGLSLSSSGQITGTPSAIGAYNVTITPSSGAVPSSMTFTWRVHGTISPTVSARSVTAGTPVWLRVTASDPDTGYAASYSITGLPPGMSANASGVISGWPYAPGTYTVKVSASDSLGGTGSASFTWKVGAAGNSGTTGTIRQAGGSGRCLNDPGGSTANGTQPNMWTCNGKSYQSWTVAGDGTIRHGGKCLQMAGNGSAASTALELETCNSGNGEQRWQAASYGQLENPASGKCVYLGQTSPPNGFKPTAHSCGDDVRHQFLRPAAPVVSGQPGKCLAVSGSAAELVTCSNVSSQHWTAEANGEFKAAGNSSCLKENAATAGATVSTGTCSTSTKADVWTVASGGQIPVELKNAASGLCVSVPSTSNTSGTRLVMESCAANSAGTWHVE